MPERSRWPILVKSDSSRAERARPMGAARANRIRPSPVGGRVVTGGVAPATR